MSLIETDPTVRTDTTLRLPSGVLVDLLDMESAKLTLMDIAVSLSRQVRFLGHAPLQPTVAEHSVAVEYITERLLPDYFGNKRMGPPQQGGNEVRRAALFHDATETFISDMPTPAKRALRALSPSAASTFDELEKIVGEPLHAHFGTAAHPEWAGLIHQADQIAYEYESAWMGWGATVPPRWVKQDPYIQRAYRTRDGGLEAFLRRARQLGIK